MLWFSIRILLEHRIDVALPAPLVGAEQFLGRGQARFRDLEERRQEVGLVEAEKVERGAAREAGVRDLERVERDVADGNEGRREVPNPNFHNVDSC